MFGAELRSAAEWQDAFIVRVGLLVFKSGERGGWGRSPRSTYRGTLALRASVGFRDLSQRPGRTTAATLPARSSTAASSRAQSGCANIRTRFT